MQKVGDQAGSEPQEPKKTDAPEQSQNETAESGRTQVCNASSTLRLLLFDIYLALRKGIHRDVDSHFGCFRLMYYI